MKVLLINGSPNWLGCTYTALHEVENTLHGHDIETEILYLGKQPVAGCIACMKCAETGYCFREDQVRRYRPVFTLFFGYKDNRIYIVKS